MSNNRFQELCRYGITVIRELKRRILELKENEGDEALKVENAVKSNNKLVVNAMRHMGGWINAVKEATGVDIEFPKLPEITENTINEYINSRRVDEAIKMLKQGNMKIIDIAFSVGFDNIVSFNRVFKRITGKIPSEFKTASEKIKS